MVRKMFLTLALSTAALWMFSDYASACHKGCHSGCNSCGSSNSCDSHSDCGGCATSTYSGCPSCAQAALDGSAKIIVKLPADATLTIDNEPTVSASEVRSFVSPALTPGKEYVYTLKAEVTRNGKVESLKRQVKFHAGEALEVTFDSFEATVAK